MYRDQSSGFQRGTGGGGGEISKRDQLYGDKWKLNVW